MRSERCVPLHIVRGHFSLMEIRGAKFPGRQTSATSLCALLQATTLCPSSWSAEVIDRLLLQGDNLHSTRVRHLTGQNTGPENGTLAPEQLPTKFSSKHTEYFLTLTELASVSTETGAWMLKTDGHRLQEILRIAMGRNKDGVLLTSGGGTIAIMADSTYCYVFDACSRHANSFFSSGDQAVVMKFRDLEHLTFFLKRKWLRTESTFSVMAVKIGVKSDAWEEVSFSSTASSI